jgi:hypothetical protein
MRLVLNPTSWLGVEMVDVYLQIKKIQEIISPGFVMPELQSPGTQGNEHCTCMHYLDIVCTVRTWSMYIIHLANHLTDISEIWCVKFKFPHRVFRNISFHSPFSHHNLTLRTAEICLVLCQFLSQ